MKRISILFFALVFVVSCATQDSARTQDNRLDRSALENLQYPELNPYQIPEIEIFELENGIRFYLVEDDELPLINLNMIVRSGGFMDPEDKTGLASITANVMRNGGSEMYPEDDLNQLLEDRAARMEFGMSFISGSGSLNALKDDFPELLPVLVDVMMNPLLPQEKLDLAITQRRSSIARRNDDAQDIGYREFERLIYGKDSPQGRIVEHYTLDAITRDDLVDFHQQAFTGNNLKIGLVGDFKVEEIKPLLEEFFSTIPAGERNEIDLPEVDYEFDSSIHFVDKRDVNQSVVLMGHIGGLRDNPDYAALQAMNEVLSSGFSGRLFQRVRSEQGLAYHVFGRYSSNATYPGQFFAGVFTQSANTAEAIESVRHEMVLLQEETISEEELNDTRDAILNSLVFRYDSRSRVLRERMNNEYLGLPANAFEQYIEELRELTPEDIQRVAREYMRPDQMRILVVGHGGEIGDQLERFGDIQEIDISIPRTPPGTIAGDAEAGQQWIKKMSDAILNGKNISGVTSEASTEQGGMEIKIRTEISFPNTIKVTQELPQGVLVLDYEDGSGTLSMMGQQQAMPPMLLEMMNDILKRDYLWLASHTEDITALKTEQKSVDGRQVVEILLGSDHSTKLLLDADTALPYSVTYEQPNLQTGQVMEITDVYKDWDTIDGVNVSLTVGQSADGEDLGETNYSSYSFD